MQIKMKLRTFICKFQVYNLFYLAFQNIYEKIKFFKNQISNFIYQIKGTFRY